MTESAAQKISVNVKTVFLESESDPNQQRFVFAYTITIRNTGRVAAKLLSRHWVIRDANGKVQEVQGDGVVMGGSYLMQTDEGDKFKAPIDEFLLSGPRTLH